MDHTTRTHIVAGAGAGITTSLLVCPLDVVKIRIQGQLPSSSFDWQSLGVLKSLKYIYRKEGLRGWYRGLGTTLFTYIPAMSTYFPTYNYSKKYWVGPLASIGLGKVDEFHPMVHMLSAISAGGLTNILTQPLWFIRTRLMASQKSSNMLGIIRNTLKVEGYFAFYKGMGSSMFGLFHVIIQFPLYEHLKLIQKTDKESANTPFQILLASTISKICASTATYPHEVIRTRLQLQTDGHQKYYGIVDAVRTIFKEEGWRGFYRGLHINIIRVVPAAAITFVTYEMIVQRL